MNEIKEILNRNLINSYVDKVTYYITGWELHFISDKGECVLTAAEVELANNFDWSNLLNNSPIDLTDTNEQEDTLNAIAIFTIGISKIASIN